jgi:hypothetical protein
MGDIWINGEENNNSVWREVSKRCVDIKHDKMEANMRANRMLVLHKKLNKIIENEKMT